MNRIQILIMSSIGFSLLFATGSLIFSYGQWKQLMFFLLTGSGIGVLVAPIFTPENFENSVVLQLGGGAFAGFFGILALSQDPVKAILGAIAGGAIGGTAPLWSKQIELS